MALDAGVDELVEDDVIGEVGRQDGEAGVELDAPGARGAAPKRGLPPDAQPAGREPVLPGQRVQASGEKGAGRPVVEARSRVDGFAASFSGLGDASLGPSDPDPLAEGDPPGLVDRGPGGQGDSHAPRCADGQADAAGPPVLHEQDGPDALDLEDARRLSLRN